MTFRGVNYSEKKHTAFEIFGYFLKYLGFFPGKCTGFFQWLSMPMEIFSQCKQKGHGLQAFFTILLHHVTKARNWIMLFLSYLHISFSENGSLFWYDNFLNLIIPVKYHNPHQIYSPRLVLYGRTIPNDTEKISDIFVTWNPKMEIWLIHWCYVFGCN